MSCPSSELRFIERDGRKILQQKWYLPFYYDDTLTEKEMATFQIPHEWKDVPLIQDEETL